MWRGLRGWSTRRWFVAVAAAVGIALAIGLPTDVIPNPVFGRPVPVTWWAPWVLVATAVLGGLLAATYVREEAVAPAERRPLSVGGVLAFFAVGCPVCNKLVVVALGTSGAMSWFAPVQPVLAVASVGLLGWALARRLRTAAACPVPAAR